MSSRRTDFVKAMVWSRNLRLEVQGPIAACVRDIFISVPFQQQAELLERLQELHAQAAQRDGNE